MLPRKDIATERVALALARGLSSRDFDQGIRLEVKDDGDDRHFYVHVDHLIDNDVKPVQYELLLDQRTGPISFRVHWAPSAIEKALADLLAYSKGEGQGPPHPESQAIAIAIDALRMFTKENDES